MLRLTDRQQYDMHQGTEWLARLYQKVGISVDKQVGSRKVQLEGALVGSNIGLYRRPERLSEDGSWVSKHADKRAQDLGQKHGNQIQF